MRSPAQASINVVENEGWALAEKYAVYALTCLLAFAIDVAGMKAEAKYEGIKVAGLAAC